MSTLNQYITQDELSQIKSDLKEAKKYFEYKRELQEKLYRKKALLRGTIGGLVGGGLGAGVGYKLAADSGGPLISPSKSDKLASSLMIGGFGAFTGMALGSSSAMNSARREANDKTKDHPGREAAKRLNQKYKNWVNTPYSSEVLRKEFKKCVIETLYPAGLYYTSEQDEITGPYNEFIDSMELVRFEEHQTYCYVAANLKTSKGPFTYEILFLRDNRGKLQMYQWRIIGGSLDKFCGSETIKQELYHLWETPEWAKQNLVLRDQESGNVYHKTSYKTYHTSPDQKEYRKRMAGHELMKDSKQAKLIRDHAKHFGATAGAVTGGAAGHLLNKHLEKKHGKSGLRKLALTTAGAIGGGAIGYKLGEKHKSKILGGFLRLKGYRKVN